MRSASDARQVGPNPDGDTCRPRSQNESTARIFKFEAVSWTSIPTAWKVDTDAALRSLSRGWCVVA